MTTYVQDQATYSFSYSFKYSIAQASMFTSSFNNPIPVLQLEHSNPLTLPVLWQWSI